VAILTGITTKAYISSMSLLDEKDVWPYVLNVTNEDATIYDILDLTGKMGETTQPTFSAWFNNYQFRKGVISAIDGTLDGQTAGESIQITLTADEELPVAGDLAMFVNKKIGRVQSVNTSTRVVVVQSKSGYTINPGGTEITTASTLNTVIFFSGSYDEGGADPDGRRPALTRTENSIQIFKTANKITDIQKASTIEVVYGGEKKI